MTNEVDSKTFERRYATPEGEQGLAAALLCMDVVDLLNDAVDESGMQKQQLADLLGVTPGRVSQVLHGDGNVSVAALAKFLTALGRTVEINTRPLTMTETQSPPARQEMVEETLIESIGAEMDRCDWRRVRSQAISGSWTLDAPSDPTNDDFWIGNRPTTNCSST